MSDPTNAHGNQNPYEVLGITPGTPHQVLVQAYQQRRAQFEAARASGTDPAVVDGWIQQLDSAWAILANPAARADYDARAGYAPPSEGGVPPSPPSQPVGPAPRESSGRLRAAVSGVVVLALTVAFGVWRSGREEQRVESLRDDSGALIEATTLSADDLRVGDCFLDDQGGELATEATSVQQVSAVPCGEPHDNEVVHSAFLTGASYPDEEAIGEQVGQACVPAFEEFIGIPFEESELEIGYIYPAEITFLQGNKYLECFVSDPAGKVTGSLEGSRR